MEHIQKCTENLLQALKKSREYRQFCELRDMVRKEPQLRQEINRFRKKVFEAQNAGAETDVYAEQERLCRDYEQFRRNSLVDDFLQAELRICRMIQKIVGEIAECVDLDTQEVTKDIEL